MVKISRSKCKEYVRLRYKDIDGVWRSKQTKVRSTLADIETLQDISAEIERQNQKDRFNFTFDLQERIKSTIGHSGKLRDLFVNVGFLPKAEAERYDFEHIKQRLFDYLDARLSTKDITRDTNYKRKNILNKFEEYVWNENGFGFDIRKIDTVFCQSFIEWLLYYRVTKDKNGNFTKAVISQDTAASERKWLSSLFKHLVDTGTLNRNPFDGVKVKINKRKQIQTESERKQFIPFDLLSQIEVWLEATQKGEKRGWYIYWMLTRFLGSRKNEALQLRWRDVFFNDLNGMGAVNMPAPKTGGFRRCPLMTGTGWEFIDCELKNALEEEYKRQNPNPEDYVVQGVLNLPRSKREQIIWKDKNPSTTIEKRIIDAGFFPWGKLMQNIRVTRENELRRFSKWRPEAINSIIGHSEETYQDYYSYVTDDDFMDLGTNYYKDWVTDPATKLIYSPRYSPKMSTTGAEYAERTKRLRVDSPEITG